MKKLNRKRKNHQRVISEKSARRTKKKKKHKKLKNNSKYLKKDKPVFSAAAYKKRLLVKMPLPKIFSLMENPVETIIFINDLKKLELTANTVYLDMSEVITITSGTIALLLSVVNNLASRGIIIIGNTPTNPQAEEILDLSGFFSHVNGKAKYKSNNNSNTIVEQRNKRVVPQVSAKIIRNAMKTVLGKEQRNKKLQGLFVELMANSVNHGFPGIKNKKWILSASHYAKDNIVSFSFIDNGVGILNTIKQKFGRQIYTYFNGKNDLLLTAFQGNIGSRTGLSYRGRGLPFILEKYNKNYISNLFILTNNVILDFKNSQFIDLSVSYSGTFYYFEINKDNEND